MSRPRSDDDLIPAETLPPSPIPTRCVASDEFTPARQTEKQKQVAVRLAELGARHARKNGMGRRAFFRTAAGLATSFVAMNDVYGPVFAVNTAEAQSVDLSRLRQQSLSGQFVFDCHTHFLRDDTRLMNFVKGREAVGKSGWNKALSEKEQTIEDLKFGNYVKEIYMDSDTKVSLLSNSPSETPED